MRSVIAAALLCAACSRDLGVPSPSERPVIESFSPRAGYAYAILTLKGHGFDPTPENNVVQFATKTSRGFKFTADGALLVYVPDGKYAEIAGKFSLSTPAGTSEPAGDAFEYLGLGHPRFGSPVGTARFHHQPPGVGRIGSVLHVASTVAYGVLAEDGGFTALDGIPDAFVTMLASHAGFAAAGARLVRLGEGAAETDLGTLHVRFLAVTPDETRLLVAATDPLGVPHLLALDAATLAKIGERTPPHAVLGLAALPDGRAALVGPHALTLMDAGSAAAPETFATTALLPGPVAVLQGDVVVALPDGTLQRATPGVGFGASIQTGTAEPAAHLIAFGDTLALSKPLGRLVEVIKGGVRVEAAFSGRPRTLGWDGARVLVADDESNVVESLDPATGAIAGRATLSLGLGSAIGCGQGSVVEQKNYRFLAISKRTHQIASIDFNALVIQPPIALAAGSGPALGLAVDPLDVVHIAHEWSIGRLDANGEEEIIASHGFGAPECLLFPDPAAKVVLSISGPTVTVIRDKTISGSTTLPRPIVSGTVNADGTVLLFTGDPARPGASPTGGIYTVAALEHGGAPQKVFAGVPRYQGFVGMAPLMWGPMLLFTWDSETSKAGSYGVLLDETLAPQPPVDSHIPEPGPIMLTPDRYLMVWARQGARDHVIRLANAYELKEIWDFAAYRLGGAPVAPGFDLTGEFMYIPVPEEDAIEVFQ